MSVDLRKSRDMNNALTAVLNCVEMEEERHFVSTADLFNDLFQAYSLKVDPAKVIEVETSYVGLHLGEYEASDFERLLTSFSNFENLHAIYTLKIINDAKALLKKMPNIQKCSLKSSSDNLVLVGDLHGNFRDLKFIIDKYGIPGLKYKFIFNGDFVDRGKQQIEVLLTLLYAFLLYPDRVYLNRGNHEDISMNTHSKFYPNFFLDIHDKYSDYSHVVFEAAENLFTYLPLATIVENQSGVRVFVTHGNFIFSIYYNNNYLYFSLIGGITDKTDLDYISKSIVRESYMKITYNDLSEMNQHGDVDQIRGLLWSDPLRTKSIDRNKVESKGCHFNSKRNIGSLFGYDITKKFCDKYKFNFIVRSHEVRDDGFEIDHDKCYTIFSASIYQGHNNYAAVCVLKFDSKTLEPYKFKTSDHNFETDKLHQSNIELIRKFKRLLISPEYNLYNLFKEHDRENTGYLNFDIWAAQICDTFESIDKIHLLDLKDYLCVCDDSNNSVKYETMFANMKTLMNEDYLAHLKNLFRIMDLNHDNKISISEVKETLNIVHDKFRIPKQIYERYLNIMMEMDKNCDNCIDFEEFKDAFLKYSAE